MLVIILVMFGILIIAGIVVVYVAYPHRGEAVPKAPWLGRALRKGVEKVPVIHGE